MLYEEIAKELQKEIENIKNSLAYGGSSDYHSYRESVGRIAGIETSINLIKDFVNKYIEED
jgi:sugar-specific transcriptional regulator TrmB|tara:strand:+ start:110 stop:292 length:183 start_codon:yes stop_codon:yes gene_type:complete